MLACPQLILHEPWLDIMRLVMIRIGTCMIEPQNVKLELKGKGSTFLAVSKYYFGYIEMH